MNRNEFIRGVGCLFGGALLPMELDYPEVGDILEVTLSWRENDSWNRSFMGQEFSNGDTKRFKLLDSYDAQFGECDCYHCQWVRHGRKYDFSWKSCSWDGLNYCYPLVDIDVERGHYTQPLTFHMFLNGQKNGTFTDSRGVTIKWTTVPDDGTPYHAEKVIVNRERIPHT